MNAKINKVTSIEVINNWDDYVYDIEMEDNTNHTYFANDILVHNSIFLTINPILNKLNVPLIKDGKITDKAYEISFEVKKIINKEIVQWAKDNFNSLDPRFEFKKETICDTALFLRKKRYVLHIVDKGDDEPNPCDKMKFTGVKYVTTTTPKKVKPLIREIIETLFKTKDRNETNQSFLNVFEKFKQLNLEDISISMSIKDLNKYASRSDGFITVKGTPVHVKSSIFFNELLKRFNITNKYEKITSGIKIKFFYTKTNKFGIETLGFIDALPTEFGIEVDKEIMFDKIVTKEIQRFFDSIGWTLTLPNRQKSTNVLELFS